MRFPYNVAIVQPDRNGTPEFLRALNSILEATSTPAATPGTVDPAVGGRGIANFTALPVSAGGPVSRRWEYPGTNPNTWNTRDGMMTFKGKFILNSYLAANPVAHFIIGMRVDTAMVSTQPRFHGVSFGDLSGASEGCPHLPAMQIETRATGLDPGGALRYLIPNAWTPVGKPMLDGVEYDLLVESKLAASDRQTVRFVLSVKNAAHSEPGDTVYDILVDTGDCLDPNTFLDMTQQGLVFASVFEDNLVPWSIDWYDMTVTWSEAPNIASDATPRLSRYGDTIDGDLSWTTGKRLKVFCDSAVVPDWTLFKSQTTNSATYVGAIPNGTSTASAFVAANNSDPVNFSYASVGMNGSRGELTTLNLGTVLTPPPMDVKIGTAVAATFEATGMSFPAARRVSVYCTGLTFTDWTAFKSQTTNGNTSVLAVPNGTGTVANFFATNGSGLTNFSYLSIGTNNTRNLIESGGIGTGTSNPIDLKIGSTTHTLDTTGLSLAGGLTFASTSKLINVECAGVAFSDWTAFKSKTTNGTTSVLAIPNGSATSANFLASNNPTLSGSFSFASFGMAANRVLIEGGGISGGATPPVDIKIGSTTHTFDTGGLTMSGSSQAIGLTTTRLYGLSNYGGVNALALTQAAQNMETYCTTGNIAATIGAAPADVGAAVELVARPAMAMISSLYADLVARKIL